MASMESPKGGYDYEFVSPPPKFLECSVCLLTLRDPHVISCCGNEFCQVCIERVKRDGKPCPLCNEQNFTTFLHKKLIREVNALAIRCPQKELGCEWEGELGQLQRHLNPGAGATSTQGCEFLAVECAYRCGAQLQRRLIQEHEMEACSKRPIEIQIASLVKKVEAVVIENRMLKQELDETKKMYQQKLEKELDDLKRAHHQQREELREAKEANKKFQRLYDVLKAEQKQIEATVDGKVATLEKKNTSLDLQIPTMKQELGDLKRTLHQQREDLQTHTIPLPVPPFYFNLTNFEHYQSNDLAFYSGPFYSHPGGYKMRIKIYPNGFTDARGTHMSLLVALYRGEFDNHLRWPFDGSITVQAYNRTTEQWSNERTIIMNKEECTKKVYVERCVDILTQGSWGKPKFLSLSDLNDNYLKGIGAVRFRVTRIQVVL
jgi:TNF receptor-associated factor 4